MTWVIQHCLSQPKNCFSMTHGLQACCVCLALQFFHASALTSESWPCRSDILSPAWLCLTFRHAALHLGYLWPNLSAVRPRVLARNFSSSKGQMDQVRASLFTLPCQICDAHPLLEPGKLVQVTCSCMVAGSSSS
jgi:hypothetical protein